MTRLSRYIAAAISTQPFLASSASFRSCTLRARAGEPRCGRCHLYSPRFCSSRDEVNAARIGTVVEYQQRVSLSSYQGYRFGCFAITIWNFAVDYRRHSRNVRFLLAGQRH
jgi:hypothetical protein